jgi:hypothetical protein
VVRRLRLYNVPMADGSSSLAARLSRDTDRKAEERQIVAWRSLSTVEIAGLVAGASRAARTLALAGLRARYPLASDRELTVRLAAITLGPTVARRAYPELDDLEP